MSGVATMEKKDIMEMMKYVYTSSEAAEYLNISNQRLHQLVREGSVVPIKTSKSTTLFYKGDLDQRMLSNISNAKEDNELSFDIDNAFVRDAIFYYTVQQYFNNNDKRTMKFMEEASELYDFDYRMDFRNKLKLICSILLVNEKDFYDMYLKVKMSFSSLSHDVVLVKKGDELYSKLLESTNDAPPYLFLKGNINLLNEKSVCVVGSRNASLKSMQNTDRLVRSLVSRNIVINAGLASGIDTASHTSALKYGGKTIAVIGTPINQYYPKENKQLQLEIEKKGLVVSQFPPCNSTQKWNFPLRNGTMSGLSLATIIMEAGETSGALKQADYALKQGRQVLIPLSAVSNEHLDWPKKYVSKGAVVFERLTDVLVTLNRNDVLKGLFSDMEATKNVEMD